MEAVAVYVIISREIRRFARQKTRLIGTLARPVLWLLIIGSGLSQIVKGSSPLEYQQFIFPGILGLTLLFSAFFSSLSIIWDREFGFLREILVAPVSRFSIVIGKILSGTVISVIQAVVILLLIPFLKIEITVLDLFLLFLVLCLIAFAISAFGVVVASVISSFENFNIIMNFLVMPMFFLSGAMYPAKVLPDFLQPFVKVNPLTFGIDAIKNILLRLPREELMGSDFTLTTDIVFLVVFSISMVGFSAYFFERKN